MELDVVWAHVLDSLGSHRRSRRRCIARQVKCDQTYAKLRAPLESQYFTQ